MDGWWVGDCELKSTVGLTCLGRPGRSGASALLPRPRHVPLPMLPESSVHHYPGMEAVVISPGQRVRAKPRAEQAEGERNTAQELGKGSHHTGKFYVVDQEGRWSTGQNARDRAQRRFWKPAGYREGRRLASRGLRSGGQRFPVGEAGGASGSRAWSHEGRAVTASQGRGRGWGQGRRGDKG